MKDPTPHEIDSMVDAGIAGGEYLGELGKTDLTSLSSDEWMTFVDTICTVYCYAMRRRAGAEMLIPNDAPINEINGN